MDIPLYNTDEDNIEKVLTAFQRKRSAYQGLSAGWNSKLNKKVGEILHRVAAEGDSALCSYTEQFDGVELDAEDLRVSDAAIESAVGSLSPGLRSALEKAAERIRNFQQSILLSDPPASSERGRSLALRYRPVDSAGICVPGASASLASSVLMNVIPAAVAGVKRIVIITPPGEEGAVSPDRLAAASLSGAEEIYRVFGAQAVGALAFGTETIPPVDFIAGPGNMFVAAAKKAVFGQVGIDMIAGPSEVLVLADETARPEPAAAELLAQAEHTDGSALLVTNRPDTAAETIKEIHTQGSRMDHWKEIRNCLRESGLAIVSPELRECFDLCNRLAPEHLVIMSDRAEEIAGKIKHAGAIFLGHHTPVATGDYIAGPSHTLPTGRTARFAGGLTANHFLKSSSIIEYSAEALAEDAEAICTMAETEGLPAHAASTRKRLR